MTTATTAENPILQGFYPDPSLCRVGEDFYLVNSSFGYFPGIPLFHSRDLAHWEQVGNILDRREQLPLENCEISRGIFAPTIRYHKGWFYVITTNVDRGGNFIVKAPSPQGPWSNPYYLGVQALGIDPSLFFEEDGTCYYVGTRPNPEGPGYNGDWEIWIQELDLETMNLVGQPRKIWKGAMARPIWPEGPHLYRIGEYYYLIHAEGGTAMEHSIMAARSKSLEEPFEGCPFNPVFTHRHLGKQYPVACAGHGDLFDAPQGNWYMVLLASRLSGGWGSMGRETFLAKVEWQDGWPVVNPGVGKLEERVELPLEEYRFPKEAGEPGIFHFVGETLDDRLVSICAPREDFCSLKERPGFLRLFSREESPETKGSFSYVGARQGSHTFQASIWMDAGSLQEGEGAGLLLYQNHANHLKMEVKALKDRNIFSVTEVIQGKEKILCEQPTEGASLEILLRGEHQKGQVFLDHGRGRIPAAGAIPLWPYTTEAAGGFVGCTIGMFVSSYGRKSRGWADFGWMSIS